MLPPRQRPCAIHYYRHVGSAALAASLLLQGWQLVSDYTPISPVIEGAWWLRLGPCPGQLRAEAAEESAA